MTIVARSSRHTLKFSNQEKLNQLDSLWSDFKEDLQHYINLLLKEELPLKTQLTSKLLPINNISHSIYRQVIYKQASMIVRGTLESQRVLKNNKKLELSELGEIKVDQFSIDLDERLVNWEKSEGEFNEFIRLALQTLVVPEGKVRAFSTTINLPIKHHTHSKKFKNWTRKKTIKLTKVNGKFYLTFTYEREHPEKVTQGTHLGMDQGYKKLFSVSDGKHYGQEMFNLYEKISRKKKGSRNFNQLLRERDIKINKFCNDFYRDNQKIHSLSIEDLHEVKKGKPGKKKKIRTKVMNKMQRWSYPKVVSKLERLSEDKGFVLLKVDPAYTSQTCSKCGDIDRRSRQGEVYRCRSCKVVMDADHNASLNILQRGGEQFRLSLSYSV